MANSGGPACIICATPRTGSTLLCALLESTGIAGRPQSFFRKEDTAMWARRWGVPVAPDGSVDFAAFVQAALAAGRSRNGAFAARIMWGSMSELVENLMQAGTVRPGSDADVLGRAFGPMRFVFLRREDEIAQAISWARAEQTRIWHRMAGSQPSLPAMPPVYDFDQINALVETIRLHNDAWQGWFDANTVTPHIETYEALDSDAAGVVTRILGVLERDASPARPLKAQNMRLADDLSLEWADRYRADRARA